VRSRRNAFRAIGDEGGLVVDSDESKVHVLNTVGSMIYSMLDGGHTKQQIVRAVVEEFSVSEEQAAQDLDAFLEQLEGVRGLEVSHE
jgi:hypothetical protein